MSLSIIKSHASLWKLQNLLNLPLNFVMEKSKVRATIMIYIRMELILCILASKLLAWVNFHKLTSIVIQKTPSRILKWILHGSNSAIYPKCLWKGRTISTQRLYHLRYLSCSKIFHLIFEPYLEKQISKCKLCNEFLLSQNMRCWDVLLNL